VGYSWGADSGVTTLTEAVRFIAAQPGGADRLLARHQPDKHGRCRGCTTPGTGTPDKRWPCSIFTLATNAQAQP
jgi:hypothetical protein